MDKNKISVIVPVYKVEKYIRDCIECIIGQTYTNWELLLIDDGSPDGSGAICDEYAAKDSRIKVIHKKNAGVAAARNTALESVSGEFVTFLDSDDVIPQNTLQLYIDQFCLSPDIDMVIGGFEKFYTVQGRTDVHICSIPSVEREQSKILRKLNDNCCWNECIRTSLIGSLRFQKEIRWNEDHLFNYDCITRTRAISFIADVVYRYYVRDVVSLSNVKDPFVVIDTCAKVFDYRMQMLENSNDVEVRLMIEYNYTEMFHFAVKLLNTIEFRKRVDEFKKNIPHKDILEKDRTARLFLHCSNSLASLRLWKVVNIIRTTNKRLFKK